MIVNSWISTLKQGIRDTPLLVRGWFEVPFRFRTLFRNFLSQEIRGRYAGSVGGILWTILTPLANLIILIFVFSAVLRIRLRPMETGTDSFAVYLLAGLLPWMAFAESLGQATGLFQGKASLITKVVFPLELLPVAGILVPFFLNGLGFAIFLGYLTIQGYLHLQWLWLPVVVCLHMLFTFGLVIFISSLSVFVRDVQQVIGIVLSLWLYLTPVIYPPSMVPEGLQWVMALNPMYPFIELYHLVLLQHKISWPLLAYGLVLAISCVLASTLFFGRAKHAFADVL